MRIIGILSIIIMIITLLIGKNHFDNKISTQVQAAREEFAQSVAKEQIQREELMERLNPDKNAVSIVDLLHYKALTNGLSKISIVGSSGSAGVGARNPEQSWVGLLQNSLEEIINMDGRVILKNHALEGFSTQDMINEKIYEQIINDNPDVIILETSILANHEKSISLEQTKQDIDFLMTTFKDSLPNTVVLLMSPNPSGAKQTEVNGLNLKYNDYLYATTQFITESGWRYLYTFKKMNEKITQLNVKLDDILVDGINPNDKGHQIWFEVLEDYLKNEKTV